MMEAAGVPTPERRRAMPASSRAPKTTADPLRSAVAGIRGEVRFNASLRDLTSFRIGGPADVLVVPQDLDDLCRLSKQAKAAKLPLFVLGGTNVLIRDGGIRGIVVSLSKFKTMTDEPGSVVYAAAGVTMPVLLQHAIGRSLAGLEWAAGIPGTVGGCLVMNAGTRLGEMKDAVQAVRLVRTSGVVQDLDASSIRFSYRKAHLPRGIVAGVWMRLTPGKKEHIQAVVKDYLRYRKDTQPLTLANAGCAFKNPRPDTAGRVIEAAGLKGYRIGDAQVSEKHANFIVNRGNARSTDVIRLIQHIRRRVRISTGLKLGLELKIVGER
jgi:UDP-N-acetylmuramate dehydrogenase